MYGRGVSYLLERAPKSTARGKLLRGGVEEGGLDGRLALLEEYQAKTDA